MCLERAGDLPEKTARYSHETQHADSQSQTKHAGVGRGGAAGLESLQVSSKPKFPFRSVQIQRVLPNPR